MKIVIRTQFMENYGAHTWDGTGTCPQHWKFKGGSTYVVPGLAWADALDGSARAVVDEVIEMISIDDDYSREYVIDWSFEEDDHVATEEWDAPFVLSKQGDLWKQVVKDQVDNLRGGYKYRETTSMLTETGETIPGSFRVIYSKDGVTWETEDSIDWAAIRAKEDLEYKKAMAEYNEETV